MTNLYNIVVVGSGPAGLTVAGLLARQGLKVLLIGGDPQPIPCLPEIFDDISAEMVQRLGLDTEILSAVSEPYPIRLTSFMNGFPYYLTINPERSASSSYEGMRLDRAAFERMLLFSAVKHGVTYLPHAEVENFIANENGKITDIICSTPEGSIVYQPELVIETRPTTPLSKYLGGGEGEKLPEKIVVLLAKFSTAQSNGAIDKQTVATILDSGYVLYMPQNDRVSSVMVVIELEKDSYLPQSPDSQNVLETVFKKAIMNSVELSKIIPTAEQLTPVRLISNHHLEYKQYSGDGFLMVGDAVAFFDPFSCSSVAIGMKCGELAANFVDCHTKEGRTFISKENFSTYDQKVRSSIEGWHPVLNIENLSLSSIGLLKQSLALVGSLNFRKLNMLRESITTRKNELSINV
jgi:flavin-dependent dehydrogenase